MSPSRRDLLRSAAVISAAAVVPSLGCSTRPASPVARGACDDARALTADESRALAAGPPPLAIVQNDGPAKAVLRLRSRELSACDDVVTLERRLRESLASSERGVGLAAPQVALGVRAIVVMIDARGKDPHVVFFANPTIVERSDDATLDYEGCLSIPGVCGMVRRSRRVVVEHGVDRAKRARLEATGFDARIFQHEIDHLDGVLYVDRVEGGLQPKEKLKELREQLRKEHPELAMGPVAEEVRRTALL